MEKRGLTIIELLVTLSIVAITGLIICQSAHSVRTRSKTIICSSNIRQITLAMLTYEQDNGTFPPGCNDTVIASLGNPVLDVQGLWWFNYIDDITENESLFWCPSRNLKSIHFAGNILCGNYGVNRSICKNVQGSPGNEFVGKPPQAGNIDHASRTLLMVDSGYSLISWKGVTDECDDIFENPNRENVFYVPGLTINLTREIDPDCFYDAVSGRHPKNFVNATYVDGHISSQKADLLTVSLIDDQHYNVYPLWVPE